MERSQIREMLLAQHAELRRIASEVEAVAKLVAAGDGAATDLLQTYVRTLVAALSAHNADEQRHLADFLPDVDAWGHERLEILRAQHDGEHAEMMAALREMSAPTTPTVARGVIGLMLTATLREHMLVEETHILTESVLRDDSVNVQFGG